MEMKEGVRDFKIVVLVIRVDTVTSRVVIQDRANFPLNQVNGKVWVGREVQSHSPSHLEVPVAQPHLVLVWMTSFPTFLVVMLRVEISSVGLGVAQVLNPDLNPGLNLDLEVIQ